MKCGKIEDFLDYSGEKLRQFPARSRPIDLIVGVGCLSCIPEEVYYDAGLMSDSDLNVRNKYFDTKMPEYIDLHNAVANFSENAFKKTEEDSLEDPIQLLSKYYGFGLSRASLVKGLRLTRQSILERVAESGEDDPAGIRSQRHAMITYTGMGDDMERIRSMKHPTPLEGEQKLQEAERLMREGFRSLEKAKSESPVLDYDDNLDERELSSLSSKADSYCRKISESIELLDESRKLSLELLVYTGTDPNVISEAEQNFFKTEIHTNFEKGRLYEAYSAFNFLLKSSNNGAMLKEVEESLPNQKTFHELSLTQSLMMDSLNLKSAKECFQYTMALCDEAAGLGYPDLIPEGCKTHSQESIPRIGNRSYSLDGIIALKGTELADQLKQAGYLSL